MEIYAVMPDFLDLLCRNPSYRALWAAQVVSEIGDYFNNIAVFSLVMQTSGSGLVVSGVMLSRAIPAALAGPVAGVLLDRLDRKRILIASDLVRAVLALGFILTVAHPHAWMLYLFSALLMFASPFFTSGRAAILPALASGADLHTANSTTQTTSWITQAFGSILAGWSIARLGYEWAFVINAASFLFSAIALARIHTPAGFTAQRTDSASAVRPWSEYREGLRYLRRIPLLFGIALLTVGWALGGGAAQILFTLFGDKVFHRGAAGIGSIWGLAGLGLLLGGVAGHMIGKRVGFRGYKRAVTFSYLLHGLAYVAFARAPEYWLALLMVCLSRVGMAVATVLNYSQLLRHTSDAFRGRVFSTLESLRWSIMIFSMAAAGVASQTFSPRAIAVIAGLLATLTAAGWAWADATGRLPSPERES